ncbi:MAG TPA: hypothetical protein VM120_02845, partial [Bryobacteraceae bacterium]|nr:hypothetical protein [Bryobacteraceae bacterium]
MIAAKGLAEGAGYRILSLPDQPYQTKYPPVYPLLLSISWKIQPQFPDNLPIAMTLTWIWLPLYVSLCWLQFGQFKLRVWERKILCIAVAVNPVLAFMSANLMPEMLFSSLLLASLLLINLESRSRASLALPVLAGLLAGIAWLTKSAATPLLISGPLWYVLRKQYLRAAFFLLSITPPALLWLSWSLARKPPGKDAATLYYSDYLRYYFHDVRLEDVPWILVANSKALLKGIGNLIALAPSEEPFRGVIGCLLAFLAASGILRITRNGGWTP